MLAPRHHELLCSGSYPNHDDGPDPRRSFQPMLNRKIQLARFFVNILVFGQIRHELTNLDTRNSGCERKCTEQQDAETGAPRGREENRLPVGLWPQSLGETLRLLRHRARISRDDLAERAGVSAGAISNYENDVSMPPALTLRRICWALGAALGQSTQELWAQFGLLFDRLADGPGSAAPAHAAE